MSGTPENWQQYAANFLSEATSRGLSESQISICLEYGRHLFNLDLPIIYDTEHFCKIVGYKTNFVERAAKHSRNFYRHYNIPKRSGGVRTISEPLPSLMEIQRWILENILEQAAPHIAAKAFIKSRSIKENARFHRRQRMVLVIDVKDFFPSISFTAVRKLFESAGYSQEVALSLSGLCTLNGGLPQGAPTSPAISNLICYSLDEELLKFARSKYLRYTRYADDLTFSGDVIRNRDIKYVYKILRSIGFEPNFAKTRLLRSHQRQVVTGIVVNEFMQVSKDYRRELRKHAFFIGKFGLEEHAVHLGVVKKNFAQFLRGKAVHALNINPADRDARDLLRLLAR